MMLFKLQMAAWGLVLLLVTTVGMTAWSQEPARRQLEELSPLPAEPAPSEESQAKEKAPGGDELGPIVVLRRAPRYRPFQVFSDSQYVYNSNVLLTPNNQQSDYLYYQTLGASYTPRLFSQLVTALSLRQQFIRYNHQSFYDFDAQTAALDLRYPVKDWCLIYGGFSGNRFYFRRGDDEFLKYFDTTFGVRRGQYFGSRLFVYYGYQLEWFPSSPSDLNRLDNALYLGANLALLPKLALQVGYRIRAMQYYESNRFDFDNTVTAALSYQMCEFAAVRATASFVDNNSNSNVFDYQAVGAGGALSLSLRF